MVIYMQVFYLTRNLTLRLLTRYSSPRPFPATCVSVAMVATTLEAALKKEQDLVSVASATVKVDSQDLKVLCSVLSSLLTVSNSIYCCIEALKHNAMCR
jgi:hypothetical protein